MFSERMKIFNVVRKRNAVSKLFLWVEKDLKAKSSMIYEINLFFIENLFFESVVSIKNK